MKCFKKLSGTAVVFAAVVLAFGAAGCSADDDSSSNIVIPANIRTDNENKKSGNDKTEEKSSESEEKKVKYIGTKTPDEAKAVGDIVFSDGSATPYCAELELTAEQKSKAVSVIFYAGTGEATVGSNVNILGRKTLGVGIHNTEGEKTNGVKWLPGKTQEWVVEIEGTSLFGSMTVPDSGMPYYQYDYDSKYQNSFNEGRGTGTFYVTGDFDGSDNWEKVCAADPNGTSAENVAVHYPAFNWVNNYALSYKLPENMKSGWYFPSGVELRVMYDNKDKINSALEKVDGTKLTRLYWSSSQNYSASEAAYFVSFVDGYFNSNLAKSVTATICAVKVF